MIKKVIVIILSLITLASCNYVVEKCEGFPNEDLKHIPYNIGDIIQYENGVDTISFTIKSFNKTEPYEIRGSFPQTGFDDCNFTGFYETSQESKYGYLIRDEFNRDFIITIDTKIGSEKFNRFNSSNQFKDFIDIKDIRLENVTIFEKDTLENPPLISRVLKADNKGIIQFYDFRNKESWNLIINK